MHIDIVADENERVPDLYEVNVSLPEYVHEGCLVKPNLRTCNIFLKNYIDKLGVSPDDDILVLPTAYKDAHIITDQKRIDAIASDKQNEPVQSLDLGLVAGISIEDTWKSHTSATHPRPDYENMGFFKFMRTLFSGILEEIVQESPEHKERRTRKHADEMLEKAYKQHRCQLQTKALDFIVKGAQVAAFNHAVAEYDKMDTGANAILLKYSERGPSGTHTNVLTEGTFGGGLILGTGTMQGEFDSQSRTDFYLNIFANVDFYNMR